MVASYKSNYFSIIFFYKDYKQDGFYIAKKVTLEPKFKLSVNEDND